jgi:hypothetical protein
VAASGARAPPTFSEHEADAHDALDLFEHGWAALFPLTKEASEKLFKERQNYQEKSYGSPSLRVYFGFKKAS